MSANDSLVSDPRRITSSPTKNRKSIFPQKLWRLVNDPALDIAIKWADDGLSFFIFEGSLKRLCLGKENHVFFTRKTKSFIRQLHLYGFRKVNKNQFAHQFFQRGRPDLLGFVKRTYKPPPSVSSNISSHEPEPSNIMEPVMTSPIVEPINWFEVNLADISYNYNEESILTLYNSDIYPNTNDDNNITL